MKKIGVVCFDNYESVNAGWSSVDGSEPKRINGIGDLSSSVLWVSNLPFYYYRKLNLIRNPNIYDQQFFRTSLKLLGSELGLDDDIKLLCKHASKIFQRVYEQGALDYQIVLDEAEYRYNTALASVVLPSNVRQIPSGQHSSLMMEAFKESTQQNQAMIGNATKGAKARTFAFPKGAYARTLLSQKLPSNSNWKKVNGDDIKGIVGTREDNVIKGTQAFVKHCEKAFKNKAVFFKISVTYTSKFFRSFATFAMGSNYQRKWITLPELMEVIKYSVVEIEDAYEGDTFNLSLENIDFDIDEYSISRGLYLENLWTAFSLPINDGEYFNPVGAYLRAFDRMLCLKAAYVFAKNNFRVGSFGTGRVIVYVKPNEDKLAASIALEEGLLPPKHMVNKDG